jgi:VWFA-related protein
MMIKHRFYFPVVALAILAFLAPPAFSQERAPAAVSIAARVFDGGQFVSGLTRDDFEVVEGGVPQKVEALYEVNGNAIIRHEGESLTPPLTLRRFYLLFLMYEYNPKVSEALRYFFEHALLPDDTLEIQTPLKVYRLTPQAFAQRPRDVLANELDNIVKKDINQANFAYKGLIRDLRRFASAIEGLNPIAGGDEQSDASSSYFGLEFLLNQYRDSLHKLEALRALDEPKIIAFAQALKKQEGRKCVFFIYQQEFRPELSSQEINTLIDNNQDNQNVLSQIHELFQVYHENISLDQKKIVEAFCDSAADVNFLFMTRTPERFGGVTMHEQSEDIFKIFAQVATATGGIAESTQNPAAEIRDALKDIEKYYLLVYAPVREAKAGDFNAVSVRVKGKSYRVLSRQGYIAN